MSRSRSNAGFDLDSSFAAKAPLASPALTGTPTVGGTAITALAGLHFVTPTSVAGTGVSLSGGTVSFSSATAVSVNGCFTSTYQNYVVMLTYVGSTANVLYWRERLSGTDAATSYAYAANGRDVNGTSVGFSSASATQALVGQGATTAYSQLDVRIMGPNLARVTTMLGTIWSVSGGILYQSSIGATHAVNTAYDGLTFYPDTGNITGELFIYGFKS